MNYPSINALRAIAGERAWELRKVLESNRATLESMLDSGRYPATASWYSSCFNPLPLNTVKLSMASEITGDCGVEYIPAGKGSKSPSIEYVNTGDPYRATIMWTGGRYRVGCWSDIVEQGNYQ